MIGWFRICARLVFWTVFLTVFHRASAVTVKEIYSFPSLAQPDAPMIQGSDGAFYGTTSGGGEFGAGTIYKFTTNGVITRIATFAVTNGSGPNPTLVEGDDGAFYGTTRGGGAQGLGTVFRMSRDGGLSNLCSFSRSQGGNPVTGLAKGGADEFFGATQPGFTNAGFIFRVSMKDGMSRVAELPLDFGGVNSVAPFGSQVNSLICGADGALYGTTQEYGPNNSGTVFRVTTNGVLSLVAGFPGTNVFAWDAKIVEGVDGAFYVSLPGFSESKFFRVTTNGEFTVLATLTNTVVNPGLVRASDGSFYGSIEFDDVNGLGAIFRLTSTGDLTILASLDSDDPIYVPLAGVTTTVEGDIFGTCAYGGSFNYGGVFQVTTGGLFIAGAFFHDTNGATPWSGLVEGSDGELYGTTQQGGEHNMGTVFKITKSGDFASIISLNFTNGASPCGELILGTNDILYGTTSGGGDYGAGTIFKLTTNAVLNTISSFDGKNGLSPWAGLCLAADGTFYGTTLLGGTNGIGSVFQMTHEGVITDIASFSMNQGTYPSTALIQGADGALYGTTSQGGTNGAGAVFRVSTDGALTGLVTFGGTNGSGPSGSLTLGVDGLLYGATVFSGDNGGSVFAAATNGAFRTVAQLPYPFSFVAGALVPDGKGGFYGNAGRFYRVKTNGIVTMLTSDPINSLSGRMLRASDGKFSATTWIGGSRGGGAIYRMDTDVQMHSPSFQNGSCEMTFDGIPGDDYEVLRAAGMAGEWDMLGTVSADENGIGHYTDSNPPANQAFYRVRLP